MSLFSVRWNNLNQFGGVFNESSDLFACENAILNFYKPRKAQKHMHIGPCSAPQLQRRINVNLRMTKDRGVLTFYMLGTLK